MRNAQVYCDGNFVGILGQPDKTGLPNMARPNDEGAPEGDIPAFGFLFLKPSGGRVASLAGNNLPNWNRYRRPESLKGARGQKTPRPVKGKRTALIGARLNAWIYGAKPQLCCDHRLPRCSTSGLRFSFSLSCLSSLFSKGGGLGGGFLFPFGFPFKTVGTGTDFYENAQSGTTSW